jgi:hypothetical protein
MENCGDDSLEVLALLKLRPGEAGDRAAFLQAGPRQEASTTPGRSARAR